MMLCLVIWNLGNLRTSMSKPILTLYFNYLKHTPIKSVWKNILNWKRVFKSVFYDFFCLYLYNDMKMEYDHVQSFLVLFLIQFRKFVVTFCHRFMCSGKFRFNKLFQWNLENQYVNMMKNSQRQSFCSVKMM